MADIHVLTGDGKEQVVVLHILVPSSLNAVGVSWRDALVNSGLGGTTQMPEGDGPGQIATSEKTRIESGELVERRITYRVEGNGDSANSVQANLRTQCARESALALAALQEQLKYFGHVESRD